MFNDSKCSVLHWDDVFVSFVGESGAQWIKKIPRALILLFTFIFYQTVNYIKGLA